jgi:hypothetical protein
MLQLFFAVTGSDNAHVYDWPTYQKAGGYRGIVTKIAGDNSLFQRAMDLMSRGGLGSGVTLLDALKTTGTPDVRVQMMRVWASRQS